MLISPDHLKRIKKNLDKLVKCGLTKEEAIDTLMVGFSESIEIRRDMLLRLLRGVLIEFYINQKGRIPDPMEQYYGPPSDLNIISDLSSIDSIN